MGTMVDVLVEEIKNNASYGHIGRFFEARLEGNIINPGEYVNCIVSGYDGNERVLVCKITEKGE
jgi:hypothetical protein